MYKIIDTLIALVFAVGLTTVGSESFLVPLVITFPAGFYLVWRYGDF